MVLATTCAQFTLNDRQLAMQRKERIQELFHKAARSLILAP
jgi:hypothetical protein